MNKRISKSLLFLTFIGLFLLYWISSAGYTPYNYFTRLAEALLQGKYWLTESPSWLSELIPAGVNKFYVVYPPGPALLLMLPVALFGVEFPQQYLAHALGAGIVILTIKLAWKVKKDKALAVWSGILIGLGSIVWYMSATGSVWYLGQISAAFFLTAALWESFSKKRLLLSGTALALAYLSRLHVIASLPFFVYLLKDRFFSPINYKNILKFIFPLALVFIIDSLYNYARYGVIWNQGYFLLPEILNETSAPWFAKGVSNIAYIPDNLKMMFLSFPKLLPQFPFVQPSWAGLAIWITTPAFVFALRAPLKETLVRYSWLAILPIFLVVASHGGTGFAQFGYRFAVDFYPFLILLTIKGVARSGLKWYHWLLLILGVLVNLWGVIWINKFGWVGF